jgi:hypothetical protein
MCAAMDGLVDTERTPTVDPPTGRPLPTRGPGGGQGRPDPHDPTAFDRAMDRIASVPITAWVNLVVVGACMAFVLKVVQWREILRDNTPTGGDMGAHVWGPAYLRDHLLPHGQLVGWTPDWYAGFPAFQFYMVLPSLAIVAIGGFAAFAIFGGALTATFTAVAARTRDLARRRRFVIATVVALAVTLVTAIGMPYGIAFKIVTVSGLVSMPVSAFALGKCARIPFPGPPLLAVATLPFLFDRSFNIYGGNIASTMAGEFAFSMSLSLSVLALGLTIRAMDTGRGRGWAAIVFACAGLCHIFPAVWAAVVAVLYCLVGVVGVMIGGARASRDGWVHHERRLLNHLFSLAAVMPVAGLLGAWWALPFQQKSTYLNDMGWEKLTWFKSYLLTRNDLNPSNILRDSPPLEVVIGIAAVGALLCLVRRNRLGIALLINCIAIALLFIHMPQLRLWNARMLPFYYLSLYFLCGLALYESVRLVIEKVWARWFVVWALGGLVIVEVARAAVEASDWEGRLGRVLPGQYATTAGALLVGGLATLVSARRGGARLVVAPIFTVVWIIDTRIPDGWSSGGVLEQITAVVFHVAQFVVAYGLFGLILVEVLDFVVDTRNLAARETGTVFRWASAPVAFVAMLLVFGPALRSLPGGHYSDGKYRWGIPGIELTTADDSYLDDWARYNYKGLEGKPAWPEYLGLVKMTQRVAAEHGCGRSMWEYGERLGSYGTPMAPMLLPHFTDGCIGSMEGLYFEASSTTPFHFITQSALSEKPSSPQRELSYPGFDMDLGIQELQMLGVRYYLAYTDKAVNEARANPSLTEVDSAGVWHMFLIADSELVVPLQYSPVVYDNVGEEQDEWVHPGVAWFKDPTEFAVLRAASGPDDWPRYEVPEDLKLGTSELADKRAEAQREGEAFVEPTLPPAPRVELPEVTVSNIDSSQRESLEFDVDQVGVPVLVKVSYFPNWKVDGADGPYRVTPNLMVVVPTDTHVRLHYGYTGIDYISYALTGIGILLTVGLFRLRPGWPLGPEPEPAPVAPAEPLASTEPWTPTDEPVDAPVEQAEAADLPPPAPTRLPPPPPRPAPPPPGSAPTDPD